MAAAWAQCSTCETGETGETAESQAPYECSVLLSLKADVQHPQML